MRSSEREGERLEILDALRGIACLAVGWFHITHSTGFPTPGSWLNSSGERGWVGIEVFFVISGFVVPYSMLKNNYRLADFGRFLFSRLMRLGPPYIVAIAALLLIAASLSVTLGKPFPYSPVQTLLHVGFINALFGYPWLDPVFWILEVEVQFYVLIALGLSLSMKRNLFWLVIAPMCVVASFAIRKHDLVFQYLPYFLMGIAALHYRRRMIGMPVFLGLVLGLSITVRFLMGGAPALAGLLAAVAIGKIDFAPRPLVALGTISYSLYLMHTPVLQVVRIIMGDPLTLRGQIWFVTVNLVAGVVVAWAFYRAVELPSQRLSRRVAFNALPSAQPCRVESLHASESP